MQKFLKSKKNLLVVAIVGLVLLVTGATYAWFSYGKEGTKQHTISSGSIKFHYSEDSQGITLNNALPMTDEQGMAGDYFEFSIDSKTSDTVDIPYYITARRSGTGTNMDNVVKVYLTKVVNNTETPVEVVTGKTIAKVSELGNYVNNDGINIPNTEHLLHTDKVFAGTSSYNQVYRLRMWIDDKAEFIIQQEGEEDIYPYNGKTYTLKVNVYGSAAEVNQSTIQLRTNTDINDIGIDNNILTTTTETFEGTATMPAGETSMTKQITVNTENPNSTVTVEKLNGTTGALVEEVKRLSTNLTLNLGLGENNFKITVTPEDPNANIQIYSLKITVSYPSYEVSMIGNNTTFDNDSINITYRSTNTVTVTPAENYYISNGSCTNGYTITGLTIGPSATSAQTLTINNNNNTGSSTCTFAAHGIESTVTLNNQSATAAGTASVTGTYGSNMPNITKPTKTYTVTYNYNGSGAANTTATSTYTFGGYFTETNGAGTKYYNEDGTSAKNWDKTVDTTLYAKWTGGSVTLPTPTRSDYTFGGWYTAATGGTKIGLGGISYTPTANITLYAHWGLRSKTIDYNGTTGLNGSSQTYTAPIDGVYRFDLYGAQGGSDGTAASNGRNGGYGAFLSVRKTLTAGQVITVNVGGRGEGSTGTEKVNSGGWNGGGSGYWSGGGGGRTDIYLGNTLLAAAAGGGGNSNNWRGNVSYVADGRISTNTTGNHTAWQGQSTTSSGCGDGGGGGAGYANGGLAGISENCGGSRTGYGGLNGYSNQVTLVNQTAGSRAGHGVAIIVIESAN